MTKVVFYKSQDTFYGFDIEGHTGLADAGEDVLCAAISAMTMFVINAAENTYHAPVTYTVDDKKARITFTTQQLVHSGEERMRYAVCGLIGAYYIQLKDMERDYAAYLSVQVRVTSAE